MSMLTSQAEIQGLSISEAGQFTVHVNLDAGGIILDVLLNQRDEDRLYALLREGNRLREEKISTRITTT